MQEEIAPPPESWPDHLRGLDNRQLADLAKDYRWLDEEAKAGDSAREFHARREAIIAECERRGIPDAARDCRPAA